MSYNINNIKNGKKIIKKMNKSNQEKILECFKAGRVAGETVKPKHIQTMLSNVFLFSDRVYKIYSGKNEFFNEAFFGSIKKKERFNFSKKDFAWNRNLSPEVYLELRGCVVENNIINFVDKKRADELAIVMKKLNIKNVLTNRLYRADLSKDDYFSFGQQLAHFLESVPALERSAKRGINIECLFRKRRDELRKWTETQSKYIRTDEIVTCFRIYDKEFEKYIDKVTNNDLGFCLDIHMENIIFDKGSLFVFDTYQNKKDWQIEDKAINFYRVAADILIMSGKAAFQEFKKGFTSKAELNLNTIGEDFFIIYQIILTLPYLYSISKKNSKKRLIAEYYHGLAIKYLNKNQR